MALWDFWPEELCGRMLLINEEEKEKMLVEVLPKRFLEIKEIVWQR